ncbi:cytochrome c3 family protein [Ferrimonas senticii]|uniref:cytochrome c3 family protein n=1 Tax=Ferrimonas senticii TaxID=394566 RepID=UPI00040FA8D4|nr:cytochrome c3 family protein [Ferrimonas senticii]
MKKLTLLAASLLLAMTAHAGEIVKQEGGMKGRSQHAFIYQDDCQSCHDKRPRKYMDDKACRDCHGDMKDIEIPKERLKFEHADPHQSPHYGEGASCIACHSEHKTSAPACEECHRAWFDER